MLTVSPDLFAIDDDIADMHAHAEVHALLFRLLAIALGERALHFGRARDRLERRAE